VAPSDLSGTVALVTGASSGIGEATARTLARQGAAVAMAARRTDRLEALGGEIADAGGTALPIEADLTQREQAEAAVAHTVEELGRLDILVNISSVAGRVARRGSGVYNATKFGVGAFSESLRQEVTRRHVRVSLVEPGAVTTELQSHNRPEVLKGIEKTFDDIELLQAEDIADAIGYVVTRPRHVAVNEILVRPTEQER
jgi:NADP-dependent 3-hydroxy acid dehydrogenase YdfG